MYIICCPISVGHFCYDLFCVRIRDGNCPDNPDIIQLSSLTNYLDKQRLSGQRFLRLCTMMVGRCSMQVQKLDASETFY